MDRRPAFGAKAADGLAASASERRVSSIADLDWPAGIFAKSRPMANLSVMTKKGTQKTPATLGDVLYAKSKAPVPEQDWATLVQSIAAGDQLALHALYERAHRIVFTLIMRITANRETAEELTIDVFHDIWRRASCYDAAKALAPNEVAAAEAHIASCPDCQRELESLRPVVDRFISWPTDVLRPTSSLQARLALRIAAETGKQPVLPPARRWSEPDWEQVAPGIECKLLATDTERHRVSMLVRLAPAASYPRHTHAGAEQR